eukprot:9495789-Pyramimonas_sp.AAC.1
MKDTRYAAAECGRAKQMRSHSAGRQEQQQRWELPVSTTTCISEGAKAQAQEQAASRIEGHGDNFLSLQSTQPAVLTTHIAKSQPIGAANLNAKTAAAILGVRVQYKPRYRG